MGTRNSFPGIKIVKQKLIEKHQPGIMTHQFQPLFFHQSNKIKAHNSHANQYSHG